ncbi:MAG TPA: glycosyltransferase family 1 protein [Chloroflexota bacterium]|nr:glycosyltransferase family 1 protein [Chloroflexota bacterium]
MRFGYLTYGLDRPHLGISRTVLDLGKSLAERPDCEPVFITPYARGPFAAAPGAVRLPAARLLPALMTLGALAVPAIAHRRRLPLIHDPAGVSPFLLGRWAGDYKRVVTLHDAIAFRYPDGYSRLNNFLHRRYIPATLAGVDAVITVSASARDDLVRFLRLPSEKVFVVPMAANPTFRPQPPAAALPVAARYGAQPPYVLYVGAVEARKDLPTLLRAFARLRAAFPRLTLVVAGRVRFKATDVTQTLAALDIASAVRFTGFVPDEDLPALYGAAAAFCFPSLYEGFGLPVLESMACGTPVVCTRASSLPEVAGGAALLFEPRDDAALAEHLARILSDPSLAEDLRRRGLARAATFSWARTAEATRAVYRHVTAGRAPRAAR